MKISYSKKQEINRQSRQLLKKADSLLQKRRPKSLRREKFAELKNKLMFSHLTEKDFFWDSFQKEFRHIKYKKLFEIRLGKCIENAKNVRAIKRQTKV